MVRVLISMLYSTLTEVKGVSAPLGITRFYYFAYPVGLLLAFFSYWAINHFHPPPVHFSLKEWKEPKDYIREEERAEVFEATVVAERTSEDVSRDNKTAGEVKVQSMDSGSASV